MNWFRFICNEVPVPGWSKGARDMSTKDGMSQEEVAAAESEQVDEQVVADTLQQIAKLIRSLEGMPVEFDIAKRLSELLKYI